MSPDKISPKVQENVVTLTTNHVVPYLCFSESTTWMLTHFSPDNAELLLKQANFAIQISPVAYNYNNKTSKPHKYSTFYMSDITLSLVRHHRLQTPIHSTVQLVRSGVCPSLTVSGSSVEDNCCSQNHDDGQSEDAHGYPETHPGVRVTAGRRCSQHNHRKHVHHNSTHIALSAYNQAEVAWSQSLMVSLIIIIKSWFSLPWNSTQVEWN